MGERRKAVLRYVIVCIIATAILVTAFAVPLLYKSAARDVSNLGVQAVKLLYDFETVEQLDYQMKGLRSITTEEVYNQLTIDNEERTLNTYFKFQNESVNVHVIKKTDQYVMYKLKTKSISENRRFVFFFHVNDKGKIDEVREVEAIDFIDYLD